MVLLRMLVQGIQGEDVVLNRLHLPSWPDLGCNSVDTGGKVLTRRLKPVLRAVGGRRGMRAVLEVGEMRQLPMRMRCSGGQLYSHGTPSRRWRCLQSSLGDRGSESGFRGEGGEWMNNRTNERTDRPNERTERTNRPIEPTDRYERTNRPTN